MKHHRMLYITIFREICQGGIMAGLRIQSTLRLMWYREFGKLLEKLDKCEAEAVREAVEMWMKDKGVVVVE